MNVTELGSLLQVKQVAAVLGVSPRTVWRMIADHQLRAIRVRGCTRVESVSVQEYVRRNEQVRSL